MNLVSKINASRDVTSIKRRSHPRYSVYYRCSIRAASLAAALGFIGCGQSANPVVSPSANMVNSYFGGPFSVTGSDLPKSIATFDHSAEQIEASSFVTTGTAQVPTEILSGSFESAPTGFLSITENFATTSSGVISPQNPPLTGAWSVEIPGAGALANLLNVTPSAEPPVTAGPAAMVEETSCPNFAKAASFLYVTVPNANQTTDTADYGTVGVTTQGSDVTFAAKPYLVGASPQTTSTVTGGCSNTILGALTAFPLNSFGSASNLELIAIGNSGLLASSFIPQASGSSTGAFGGGTGVLGVAALATPVDVSALVGAKYNGFVYAPRTTATGPFDLSVLASAFGDDAPTAAQCSMLQSSLAANSGMGAHSVVALPSANTIYGGEFLNASGTANDPNVASGAELCDVAIDLGTQDSANNGSFPNATVYVGSNFPPFSTTTPWNCFGTTRACAVAFPAAAIAGQVQSRFVIFVAASSASNPPAQLPNNLGGMVAQPVGIYLFQRAQ